MVCSVKVKINKDSKDLHDSTYEEIAQLSYNGIEVYPHDEEFPMPWDSVLYIKDEFLVFRGQLGPSGSGYPGYAEVAIPIDKVDSFLDMEVRADSYEDACHIKAMLTDHDWIAEIKEDK